MSKKRLIPFGMLPASWGLAGPARDEAEAYYNLEGYELELRLAEIKLTGEAFLREALAIKNRYGVLTDYEYEVEVAGMIVEPVDRAVALLDIDIRYGNIDPFQGHKEIATAMGEPWIKVVNDGVDKNEGPNGYYFEFDWNDVWIEMLREAGYAGPTEEAIIQAWFQDLCRHEASASLGAPPINGGIVY